VHKHQEDRFVVAAGDILLALWDGRSGSPSAGTLDLLPMGVSQPDDAQFSVLIPKKVHHGFMVTSDREAILLNSPTRLYDPSDEGRDPFTNVGATFNDQSPFNWDEVRKALRS
jgi:dTDP-4-dehydrorhamnose 3,5-epimerase